ncbi:MAG: RnfABCDGE type electron transport complex subunit D [Phycisphaerales bacterium]|nr:RnfABCDGE type electron transport complex subunit D [Phycisphaerales bacterium]
MFDIAMTRGRWIVEERSLTGAAPHRKGGSTHVHIVRTWILVASLVGLWGVVLFGVAALKILVMSVLCAVIADMGMQIVTRRPGTGRLPRAVLTGLLFGLTLPATAPLHVAIVGSLIAIIIGQGVFGGFLHSALVGRVVVQAFFVNSLSLSGALVTSPILAPGYLLVGNLDHAEPVADYQGWLTPQPSTTAEGYKIERPVQTLRRFTQDRVPPDDGNFYEPLVRDELPPWKDTIFGLVPGGIGETCTLMLIIAGVFLIHRGYLRWQLPVTVLASAALAASIMPVNLGADYHWFPVLEVEQGRAVGLAYVFFHLTAGQLMLGAFLLAGDVVASPMRAHGQLVFGAGIGVLTIFMRLYGTLEGECYWAILIMNALVGTINRRMKRPVLGLAG